MTKKTFLTVMLAGAALTCSAAAQDFVARVPRGPRVTAPTGGTRAATEGALQRGARVGNPVQMVNPGAPAAYGTGEEFIEYRENDPFLRPRDPSREHPVALRLFSIAF